MRLHVDNFAPDWMCERSPAPLPVRCLNRSVRMNTRLLIPLCLAGAVALACGSRTHTDAAKPANAQTVALAGAPAEPVVAPPVRRHHADTASVRIKPVFVVTTE